MSLTFSQIDSFIGNSTSRALTYNRPCPLCRSLQTTHLARYNDFQFYSDSITEPKRIDIETVQCRECLCIYTESAYSEYGFSILFSEAGMSYVSDSGHRGDLVHWMQEADALKNDTTLLDVGCFDGAFLSKLPSSINRIGIDIDSNAIRRGRKEYPDINLIHGNFETFHVTENVNTITMFHVLEHVVNPLTVLQNLYDISAKDATLLIEIPIIELATSNDIVGMFTPQHLTHFSKHSLKEMLAVSGWTVQSELTSSKYNGYRISASKSEPVKKCRGVASDFMLAKKAINNWSAQQICVESRIGTIPEKTKKIVVWGGGMHTETLYHLTSLFHNREIIYALVDSDPVKIGKTWRGITYHAPSELADMSWDDTILVVSSYGSMKSIANAANDIGIHNSNILCLYNTISVY